MKNFQVGIKAGMSIQRTEELAKLGCCTKLAPCAAQAYGNALSFSCRGRDETTPVYVHQRMQAQDSRCHAHIIHPQKNAKTNQWPSLCHDLDASKRRNAGRTSAMESQGTRSCQQVAGELSLPPPGPSKHEVFNDGTVRALYSW